MSLFDDKNIKPMLIGADSAAFDDKNFIYELKWDGERCIAYLDPKKGCELRNKRNMKMLPKVPELSQLHKQVKKRCILDGELLIIKNGKPDFFEIQKRSLMSHKFKIELASKQYPATFSAFDILYCDKEQVTALPLMERKKILKQIIKTESEQFALSRHIEEYGTQLFEMARQQELEGIVAKRKDSLYHFDKRTKDWIKIKHLLDDDFVVCGYIPKENNMTSIVLGQYDGRMMVYKGHVTLGVSGASFSQVTLLPRIYAPAFSAALPPGNEAAIWVSPVLVCTVQYMMKTPSGGMRQPVFKGLRFDKQPADCIEK